MASAKRGGKPTRPHGYDELFAINSFGLEPSQLNPLDNVCLKFIFFYKN